MLVVITYDVNTETKAGRKRLSKVAKQCVNYGVRVQNSVFECVMDSETERMVRQKLISLIDRKQTAFDFIIWAIIIREKSDMLEPKKTLRVDEPLLF